MTDRLLSGHPPLDEILGGGLPVNAISLVMGRPGSGKTILAQQYAFRNGRPDRPAVYFSTVSEPLEKIVRFGQSLAFFDTAAIGTSIFYEDLGTIVNRDGLAGVADQLGVSRRRDRRAGRSRSRRCRRCCRHRAPGRCASRLRARWRGGHRRPTSA